MCPFRGFAPPKLKMFRRACLRGELRLIPTFSEADTLLIVRLEKGVEFKMSVTCETAFQNPLTFPRAIQEQGLETLSLELESSAIWTESDSY